ncbi:hypothetical protein LCGC14_1160030 [marine sediment metagenome]|uniref:Serine protease n=1 Tax=marine sediment metagenome TaxID=412755 RepID=A0A0F9LSU0_9ZZZZ
MDHYNLLHQHRNIGKVEENFFPVVESNEEIPKRGTSVCLCGYPMTKLNQNTDGSLNVNLVRKYWQPSFVIDQMIHKNIKSFITQHPSLPGMSGGPVFDINGKVYGMDYSSLARDIIGPDPMKIRNGVIIEVKEIKTIIERLI